MIKYRPHRGTLAEAMEFYQEFNNYDELKEHVVKENFIFDRPAFDISDIVIGDIIGNDDRIGWKNVRYVCVKRYYGDVYDHPQCIGMCGE